jgi:hypothetical protein
MSDNITWCVCEWFITTHGGGHNNNNNSRHYEVDNNGQIEGQVGSNNSEKMGK